VRWFCTGCGWANVGDQEPPNTRFWRSTLLETGSDGSDAFGGRRWKGESEQDLAGGGEGFMHPHKYLKSAGLGSWWMPTLPWCVHKSSDSQLQASTPSQASLTPEQSAPGHIECPVPR
jgi:hypothetical protein